MTEVAFLGQGNMGVPMASRLVAARHRVTVWNRTKDKSATAREQGAQVAGTAADAVRDADVVVTMLRDADAVDAALFDYERAADALASGRCCWRCRPSDRPPSWTCAARLRADVALVDAPVVGSIPQATAGELRISLSCSPWGAWRGGSRAVSYPSGPQNIVRRFSRPPHSAREDRPERPLPPPPCRICDRFAIRLSFCSFRRLPTRGRARVNPTPTGPGCGTRGRPQPAAIARAGRPRGPGEEVTG